MDYLNQFKENKPIPVQRHEEMARQMALEIISNFDYLLQKQMIKIMVDMIEEKKEEIIKSLNLEIENLKKTISILEGN